MASQDRTKEPERDLVDQMIVDTEKATRLRNLQVALGVGPAVPAANSAPPAPPPKQTESIALDVAALVKAISETISAATANKPSLNNDPFVKHILDENEAIKAMISQDPMQAYRMIKGIKDELRSDLGLNQSNAGSAGSTSVSSQDLSIMLQMKVMDREMADRHAEHEREMEKLRQDHEDEKADRARRWQREDDKWAAEFNLKKEELKAGQERADNNMQAITTFATAVIGSMEQRTGLGQKAAAEQEAAPQTFDFTCTKCGKAFAVPVAALEFDCPGCSLHYKAT